ncbi:hypothetical protein [Streptomyces noursei]|uniref:hypothetical protein n=1 Tax=Streptomyces noursei TaxID=1971 RepID=UPI0023B7E5F3|nr:hypothetical protein [Streptomyces noursei]
MAERSPRDPRDPLDEEAAWAEIVAGYGERPEFPSTADRPDRAPAPDGAAADGAHTDGTVQDSAVKDGARTDGAAADGAAKDGVAKDGDAPDSGAPGPADAVPGDGSPARPGSFVVFAPGVGPRNWTPAEPSDDDFDETDEGHFTPPEPPPLPSADTTAKFAWIAVLGGPLLLLVTVLLQQPVTWWITVLGIGGFVGGLGTLFARMGNDREDGEEPPGGGAVV